MHVSNVLHAARWKYGMENLRQKSPSVHIAQLCMAISSQVRNVSTIAKKLVKWQYLNMVNLGPLTAEICWRVWGTTANFNRFRVLASLLHRRHSTEVSQTLHDVWPSPVLVYYIYIFGGSCPITEFCQLQNSLCVQVMRSPISAALLHGTRAVGVSHSLRRGTRNGVTELSQRAPPIFCTAAITSDIGPHSSLFLSLQLVPFLGFCAHIQCGRHLLVTWSACPKQISCLQVFGIKFSWNDWVKLLDKYTYTWVSRNDIKWLFYSDYGRPME